MSKRKTKTSSTSTGTATTAPNVPGFIQGPAQDYYSQISSLLSGSGSAPRFGANANQQSAFQGASVLSGPNQGISEAMNGTRGLMNFTPGQVTAGQLRDTDMSAYMNPYTGEVIDRSIADLERARQGAISQGQGAAIGAGAYGGSRHGVADSLTNREFADSAGSLAANLRNAGWGQAQDAARFDIGNRLGADTFNSQQGLAGANFRLGAAQQLGAQGAAQDANTRQNIGTQAALGAEERGIAQESDPTNSRLAYMRQIAQLLGIDPSMFTGQTMTQSGRSSGTQSSNGAFSFGWSPENGFQMGYG